MFGIRNPQSAIRTMSRREFLTSAGVGAAVAGTSGWLRVLADAAAGKRPKSCVLLWMGGGPSHLDTFDLKPDAPEGVRGILKPITTSVPGIQISETFPRLAKLMQHAAVLRGMTTPEFDHFRASYHLHTGYRAGTAGLSYPSLGAIVSSELGKPDASLPHYVLVDRVNNGRNNKGQDPGFLAARHWPLEVRDPSRGVENVSPLTGAKAFDEQVELLRQVEAGFYKSYNAPAAEAHAAAIEQGVRVMNSKDLKAFDLGQESAAARAAYGSSKFGQGCLLARRLVEVGVPFIEVPYGSWDHHGGIYSGRGGSGSIQTMSGVVDQGMSALVNDLKERGLLEQTLVIWMGEFGRTPKMNNTGRDHYSRAWSTVLAGGGIKGGQVIGKTDATGAAVTERPISVVDFFATVCTILGIDYNKNHKVKPNRRPIPIVEPKNPKPVQELLG
jgi:uncharacterized protein (DUF1501 family)